MSYPPSPPPNQPPGWPGPQSPYGQPPYGQPQYGQPAYGNSPFGEPVGHPGGAPFGAPGGYGEAPPLEGGRRRNRKPLIISAIAMVLIVALGVVLALTLGSGDDESTASEATTSAATTTTTTTPTASEIFAPPPAGTLTIDGVCEGFSGAATSQTPAGWSTVVSKRGLVYDVPPAWEVNTCSTLVGWEKACDDGPFGYCPIRTMSGSADLADPNPTCKGGLAVSGVPASTDISDIHAAVQAEARLVPDIYSSDDGVAPAVSLSTPRNLTVAGRPAVQVVATVTGMPVDDECSAPSALHSMVATTVPGQEGTVLFVVALDQGRPGALDAGVIDQMVATLRDATPA